jgi:hypothetical protein
MGRILPRYLMDTVHFLILGNEPKEAHVAGLPRMKADSVVIFAPAGTREPNAISGVLKDLGMPVKPVSIGLDYLGAYKKVSYEAASAFDNGAVVGVNMSTGPALLRTAMEDAVRIQLYHFLHHTSTAEISAFKYFIEDKAIQNITAVPIWDFATYLHNDIFEILAAAEKPIPLAQIHSSLAKTMGRDVPNWEAFRKTFREFKRAFKGSPCFVELVGKGPRYRIVLGDRN